jgi:hypothetical protein
MFGNSERKSVERSKQNGTVQRSENNALVQKTALMEKVK